MALNPPHTPPTAAPGSVSVSVIIPVHNGGVSFRQCLTFLNAAVPAPAEVIVVADGAADDSYAVAAELGAKVLRLPTQGGPARARNHGARLAQSDLLLFLDADVAVHPDALAEVVAAFREDPALAAVFGSYDDTPAAANFLSQYRNLLHHFVHQEARELASTFWTGCGAIRREVFWSIGGFDESYQRPSMEDVDLGYRLTRAGHRIQLRKTLLSTHLKRWGIRSTLQTDLLGRAVPWTRLILRDRLLVNDLNLRHANRLSVVLTFGSVAFLLLSVVWSRLLIPASFCLLTMLAINARLFRFFHHARGLRFALAAIPWVYLYQLCCGLGFGIGLLQHLLRRRDRA